MNHNAHDRLFIEVKSTVRRCAILFPSSEIGHLWSKINADAAQTICEAFVDFGSQKTDSS